MLSRFAIPRLLGALAAAACVLSPARAASQAAPFPFALDPAREVALGAAGTGLLAGGWMASRSFETLTGSQVAELDRSRVNAFDRAATYRWSPEAALASDVGEYALMAAPLVLAASVGDGEGWELALIYAETLLINNGVTLLTKGLVARPRPFVYNTDPAVPLELKLTRHARLSFPSGHSSNAFASAVFVSYTHGRVYPQSGARAWIWGGSLAVAGAVGVLRYAAGKHYPTDILAGAVIGATVGWLVPKLHEDGDDAVPEPGERMSRVPLFVLRVPL